MDDAGCFKIGVKLQHISQRHAHQRHITQFNYVKQLGAKPIINIMGVIGNIIRQGCDLRFCGSISGKPEIMRLSVFNNGRWQAGFAVVADGMALSINQRAIVFDQTFK